MAIAMALVMMVGVVGVVPLSAQDETNAADAHLFIHPQDPSLTVGETLALTAWVCDGAADPPQGSDQEPGTPDDTCSPVKASWSVEQAEVASLKPSEGKKVRLTADAPSAGTVVVAVLDELESKIVVSIAAATAAAPSANRAPTAKTKPAEPKANPDQAKKPEPKTKPAEPKVNPGQAKQAAPAEPKANQGQAKANRGPAAQAKRPTEPKANPGQAKKAEPKTNQGQAKANRAPAAEAKRPTEPKANPGQAKKVDPKTNQGQAPRVAPKAKSTASSGPTDQFIVAFETGTSKAKRLGVLKNAGAGRGKAIGRPEVQVVDVPRNGRARVIDQLKSDPTVKSVDRNHARTVNAAPNDPLYENQWHLPHIGWEALHGVKTFSNSATVAVIDTGVEATLPDLAGKLTATSSDPHGHGTWMTSILAAIPNNARDMAGVAWTNVSVLPLTAIGADGVGYDADIIAAIAQATDPAAGIDVILMAFSGKNRSTALQAAIQSALDAGIIVVASVGNEGVTTPTYPAAYPGVIGVAATRKDDVVALWSDDGPSAYIAAPGVDIVALNPDGTNRTVRGTSAAAAQVAGAAALLRADGLAAEYVADRLLTSSVPTNKAAIGRLDLAKALVPVTDAEATPPGDDDDTRPDGDGYIVEPEPTPTPTPPPTPWATPAGILGLDVSHWNGLPDFKALRAQDQRFVISKASQGTSFVDNTYEQHTADARAAGLLTGAYHFFDYRVDGTKQAQHFLATVRRTSGLNRLLPLVVDVETLKSLGTPNKAQARVRLQAMLDELYRQTGRYPMIYTSAYMWEKVVGAPGNFGTYPLWVACWECDEMILPNGWNSWTFWQWGLARFEGDVKLDGNVYSAGMGQLNLEQSRQMKLRNGAAWTGSRIVDADLRGFDGAQVRYAVGKGEFGQWQPYKRRFDLRLGRRQGNYDVRIQLRSPNRIKSPVLRDSIKLDKANPRLTRPRLSIREGGLVAASGKRVPVKATIRAKDARSGLRNASVRVVCGNTRIATRTGKGPLVAVGAPVARSGCAVTGSAKDVAGNTARKTINPKLQIIDLQRKSKSVKLTGAWKAARNKDAIGKTLARSASRGAQAKITFRGQQFGVVVRRGPSGGKVKVIVDGKHVDTIDLYSAQPDDRRIVYVRNVPRGKHVVKLRPTGTKNARSTGTTVWLDALVVLNKRK